MSEHLIRSETPEHGDFVRLAEMLLALPFIADDAALRARVFILCQADEVLSGHEAVLCIATEARAPLPRTMRESLTALTYLWLDGLRTLLRDWESRRGELDSAWWTLQCSAPEDDVDVTKLVRATLSDAVERYCDDDEPEYRAVVESTSDQLHGLERLLDHLLDPQLSRCYYGEAERIGWLWIGGPIDPATGAVYLETNGSPRDALTRRVVTQALRDSLEVPKVGMQHHQPQAI